MSEPVELTIVAPLFNEEAIVRMLIDRCVKAAEQTALRFELVLVDDASTDGTAAILDAWSDARVRPVRMPTNGGQLRATQAGLAHARGEIIAVLDGDLQDPPEVLPVLVQTIRSQRVAVVFAVKARRDDPWWLTAGARLFHAAQGSLGGGRVPRGAGSFCIMRRDVAAKVASMRVERANLAAVIGAIGVHAAAVPYDKQARYDGRSRVGFWGLVREALSSMLLSGALHRLGLLATMTLGLLALMLAGQPRIALFMAAAGAAFASSACFLAHRRWRGQRTR